MRPYRDPEPLRALRDLRREVRDARACRAAPCSIAHQLAVDLVEIVNSQDLGTDASFPDRRREVAFRHAHLRVLIRELVSTGIRKFVGVGVGVGDFRFRSLDEVGCNLDALQTVGVSEMCCFTASCRCCDEDDRRAHAHAQEVITNLRRDVPSTAWTMVHAGLFRDQRFGAGVTDGAACGFGGGAACGFRGGAACGFRGGAAGFGGGAACGFAGGAACGFGAGSV